MRNQKATIYAYTLQFLLAPVLGAIILLNATSSFAQRQTIQAAFLPLADHYAGIVAYEKYRGEMTSANYTIQRMKSWDLLRAYFYSEKVDIAFIMSPLAMDMFSKKPDFRWVGLLHRDGNALAINNVIDAETNLSLSRLDRRPDHKIADVFRKFKARSANPIEVGVPHLQSTHSVVLYKYLKEHGLTLGVGWYKEGDVVAVPLAPSKALSYFKKKNTRKQPGAFEQSLPWADVIETQRLGRIAWYSKDVLVWPEGHVECITIAQDKTISDKREALNEVLHFIRKAGDDIEKARRAGGAAMDEVSSMIRKHIPEHSHEAITQSLRSDLNVINYKHLNVDKPGLKQVMDLAVESGIIKQAINIEDFSDASFSSKN